MNRPKKSLMGYEISINKALDELKELAEFSKYSVLLLEDNYEVRVDERAVLSVAASAPAGEVEAVLILHYLIGLQKYGFHPTGEWISFKEIEGGQVFWPAFSEEYHKTAIGMLPEGSGELDRNSGGALQR